VEAGIHVANMAGTWMCLVYGFAGMRADESGLRFNPYVPQGWDEYSFKMTYCQRVIKVTVTPTRAVYHILVGDSLCILHAGKEVLLPPQVPVTVEIETA
jgi:trehalose/maltose hydrolase-like predicted phosphorylase